MESPPHKIAVLPRRDAALSVDTDAAWVTYDFAHHVLRELVFRSPSLDGRLRLGICLPADRPFGDVVGPFVGVHAGRGVAEPADNYCLIGFGGCGRLTLGQDRRRSLIFDHRVRRLLLTIFSRWLLFSARVELELKVLKVY